MSGAFGPSIIGGGMGGGLRWRDIRTGVRCIHCGKGEFLISHEASDTRWGVDGYYVTCTFSPRQGAICPWVEKTDYRGYPLTEEQARFFIPHEGNPDAMAYLLRQYCPELRDAVLEQFDPHKHDPYQRAADRAADEEHVEKHKGRKKL